MRVVSKGRNYIIDYSKGTQLLIGAAHVCVGLRIDMKCKYVCLLSLIMCRDKESTCCLQKLAVIIRVTVN